MRAGPVDVATRDDHRPLGSADERGDPRDRVGVGGCTRRGARIERRDVGRRRTERVEREIDERRTSMRSARREQRVVHRGHDPCAGCRGRRGLRDRRHDRYVVELLQRSPPPAPLRRPPAEHEHRRTGEARRRERADPVGHTGARGQRRATGTTGDLGQALRREGRGLLVAGVDELDIGLDATVVQHEQVPTREREHDLDPVRPQHFGREPASVFHRRMLAHRGAVLRLAFTGDRSPAPTFRGRARHGYETGAGRVARNCSRASLHASGASNCGE